MVQHETTRFIVTESFQSETLQQRKALLQQVIDAYLSIKLKT